MLKITDLHVSIDAQPILRGLTLTVNAGEVHALMGPNGSGKSTLAYVLAGREEYDVTSGSITYNDRDLLEMDPEERAAEGLFLAFQYPVEIPGVSNLTLLKAAVNAIRKYRGEKELDAFDLLKHIRTQTESLGISEDMLKRSVNLGFSGGEKKRNEILQMAILNPQLAILDETDSGLDIDALRIVAQGVNALRDPQRAIMVITHYQRLLDHIIPDQVHVLVNGQIKRSGGKELVDELEARGYAQYGGIDEAA